MVFWLAVLIGGLFAWIAVENGFYATWIMFFNLVVSIYMAVFLTPLIIVAIPATTDIPFNCGCALTLVCTALATYLVSYGICYACLAGQLHADFPKIVDTTAAGALGFLAGFLFWSFVSFALCLTPLSQLEIGTLLGLEAQSQATNIKYIDWWCDQFHSLVSTRDVDLSASTKIAELCDKAGVPPPDGFEPSAPPKSPAPTVKPPEAIVKDVATSPPDTRDSSPDDKQDAQPATPDKARGQSPPTEPYPPIPDESLKKEFEHRYVTTDAPDAIRAAVANRVVCIIDVPDSCTVDRFSPEEVDLLKKWVSQGGILWANNNVLAIFGIEHSKPIAFNGEVYCDVSNETEVSRLVADCRSVALKNTGGMACILSRKDVVPLLTLKKDAAGGLKAGTACWSVVQYGDGWISDPKPIDTARYDGGQFWRNFCLFCLGKIPGPTRQEPDTPPPPPRNEPRLSGVWKARVRKGDYVRIEDDGTTISIRLLQSETLKSFSGMLKHDNEHPQSKAFSGILSTVFSANPSARLGIETTVTPVEPNHLRVRYKNWPLPDSKLQKSAARSDDWIRTE